MYAVWGVFGVLRVGLVYAFCMDMRLMFRPGEVAEMFGVSERTVREWIARGEIPSVKVGRSRLVHRDWLDSLRPGASFRDRVEVKQ